MHPASHSRDHFDHFDHFAQDCKPHRVPI
jgi:hypothetical protein